MRNRVPLLLIASLLLSSPAAGQVVVDRVVAVVDDEAIFLSDLERLAAPFLEHARSFPSPSGRTRRDAVRVVYEQVLEVANNQALIRHVAEEDGIEVTEEEVDAAIRAMTGGFGGPTVWTDLGFPSRESLRDSVREQLLHYRVINARVRSRVDITEADVRARYDEMVARARRSAPPIAAAIVVPFGADPTVGELEVAQQRAEAIRAEIETVADFDRALEAHRGFELGTLDEGDLEPALESALAALAIGEVSAVVRGARAYHILLLRDRDASSAVPPYSAVRQDLYRELLSDAMGRQQELFVDGLRRAAIIERRWP